MLRLVTYLSLLAGARAYQSAAGRLPTIESRVSLGRPAMFGGMKLGAAVDAAGDHLAKPAPPPQVYATANLPSRRALLLGALGTAVTVGNAKPASAGSFNAASTDSQTSEITVGDGSAKQDWEGGSKQQVTWTFTGTVPKVTILLMRENAGNARVSLACRVPGISYEEVFVGWLALNLENTGSHVVTVPSGLVPGSYFIEIQSTSDDRVSAKSRTFTIDKTATPPAINDVAVKLPPQSMRPAQRGKAKRSLVLGASY